MSQGTAGAVGPSVCPGAAHLKSWGPSGRWGPVVKEIDMVIHLEGRRVLSGRLSVMG